MTDKYTNFVPGQELPAATMTINGGTFTIDGTAKLFSVKNGSSVVINGGAFAYSGEKAYSTDSSSTLKTNNDVKFDKAISVDPETAAAAVSAAKPGDTIVLAPSAEGYSLPAISENITLKGDGTTKINAMGEYGQSVCNVPNGAKFEGLVFDFGGSLYHGFQHAGPIEFKNCTLNGFLSTYADMTFENCTFISGIDQYSVDIYGGSNFSFTNCHFYGCDKNIYIYQETLDGNKVVSFEGCDFHMSGNPSDASDTKSAIMLNAPVTYAGHYYDVTITDCTIDGAMNKTAADNVAGKTNYQGIYGLKHKDGNGNGLIIYGKVVLDGETVYENLPTA